MSELLARAMRRNLRRARQLVAPVMLLLGLSGFALSQMPFANTSWSQDLTLVTTLETADYTPTPTNTPLPTSTPTQPPSFQAPAVSGGTSDSGSTCTGKMRCVPETPRAAAPSGPNIYACTPLTLEAAEVTNGEGRTEYEYTLNGGSARPREGCPDIVAVILPVCFNPALEPSGFAIAPREPVAGWSYSGHMEDANATPPLPRAVEWAPRDGTTGPYTATLALALPGANHPVETVTALMRDASGVTYALGEVSVPRPDACNALPPPPAVEPAAPLPATVVATATASATPTSAPAAPTTPAPAETETPAPTPSAPPRHNTTPESNRPSTPPPASGGAVWWE